MTSNSNITSTWRCSCNRENFLRHRRCKVCGDAISANVLEQIYKEEIRIQNIKHAKEEEKRTIILAVVGGFCLFFAPVIIIVLIWLLKLLMLLIGTYTGIKSIIQEYKKMQKVDLDQDNKGRLFFLVSAVCFFGLTFMFGSWINACKIVTGILLVCLIIFVITHSIRVAKHQAHLSVPSDIVRCGIKLLVFALIFFKAISM